MNATEKMMRNLRVKNLLLVLFFLVTIGTIYMSIYINQRLEESFREIKSYEQKFISQRDSMIVANDSMMRVNEECNRQIMTIKSELGDEKFDSLVDTTNKKLE